MANYSDIRGYRVKYLSSDPTLSTANEGQVWYNSTEGVLKSLVQIKAWSAGGNMGTARRLLGSAGTQTAGLAFGGTTNSTEEYNGTSWTTTSSLTTGRTQLASGKDAPQTAALAIGGNYTAATEEYTGAFLSTKTITTS